METSPIKISDILLARCQTRRFLSDPDLALLLPHPPLSHWPLCRRNADLPRSQRAGVQSPPTAPQALGRHERPCLHGPSPSLFERRPLPRVRPPLLQDLLLLWPPPSLQALPAPVSPAGCTPPGGGRWVTRGGEAETAGPREPSTLNQTDSTWTHSVFDFAFLCEENFLELRETMKSKVIHGWTPKC